MREARNHIAQAIASEESFQALRTKLRERGGIDFPNIAPSDRPRLLTDFAINATQTASLGFAMLMLQCLPEELAYMAVSFYHTSSSSPFITSDIPYAILPSRSSDSGIEQFIVPFSSSVAAVFDAGEPPVYRHRDASATNVRRVNAAILSNAREFLISRDPNVFPGATL